MVGALRRVWVLGPEIETWRGSEQRESVPVSQKWGLFIRSILRIISQHMPAAGLADAQAGGRERG